jgi:hypothetical protein
MKKLICAFFFCNLAVATSQADISQDKIFQAKLEFDKTVYKLKVNKEKKELRTKMTR